jgi:hypothetical protein
MTMSRYRTILLLLLTVSLWFLTTPVHAEFEAEKQAVSGARGDDPIMEVVFYDPDSERVSGAEDVQEIQPSPTPQQEPWRPTGGVTPQDEQAAIDAYFRGDYAGVRTLAEQGNAMAQSMLGSMYYYGEGKGVPQDFEKAVHWFRLAAKQGDDLAQAFLGHMFFFGQRRR